MPRSDKATERQRAYWLGGPSHNGTAQLVTVTGKSGRKYTIRDAFGYAHEGIAKSELDFDSVPDEQASFTFERATG